MTGKMDKYAAMQALVTVVEANSFVRAAERLQISTTALSRRIAELESQLGIRLLQRTTRKLALTEAGRQYYERALLLLADLADAEASIGCDTQAARGVLKLNAPLSFGIRHLGPLLPRYRQQQPEVSIDLTLNDRVVDLVEEGYDLAIRISRQLAPNQVARRLAPVSSVVCASPEYLARFGTPQIPQDLARHQCLAYSYTDRGLVWEFEGPEGREMVKVNGFLKANNGDILRMAAVAGMGIVAQPAFLMNEELRSGQLVPLLQHYPTPDYAVYAVYPSHRHLTAKVRTFVDFLAAEWGAHPPWEAWMQPDSRLQ